MSAVSNWWRAAPRDTSLAQVVGSYADLLQMVPQPAPAQPQPQPAHQHIGQMSLWDLLLLLVSECPDQQIHIQCPFDEIKAQTHFDCAAGTFKIDFSARHSHLTATHLIFAQGLDLEPQAVPGVLSCAGPAGSPDDTTAPPTPRTTGWTPRG